jgi:hypothetical protein
MCVFVVMDGCGRSNLVPMRYDNSKQASTDTTIKNREHVTKRCNAIVLCCTYDKDQPRFCIMHFQIPVDGVMFRSSHIY